MGLSGNLTTGEILEQIVHADHLLAREWRQRQQDKQNLEFVRNVVFMGMGEPLDNYSSVVSACRALVDRKRWNLALGKVTVSTVGVVSKIRQLTKDLPEVSLALSLHAPNQELRSSIVPTAKNFPLPKIIDALDGHMRAYLDKRDRNSTKDSSNNIIIPREDNGRRRAMIEYVMLDGPTSSFECAHQLGKLCENRLLVVNLIPYNKTNVQDKLSCPSEDHMKEFRLIVVSYGVICTIRRTMGADIDSACGQLITSLDDKKENIAPQDQADIEDTVTFPSSATSRAVLNRTGDDDSTKPSKESKLDPRLQRLERLVVPLATATALSTIAFVLSTVLYISNRRLRR